MRDGDCSCGGGSTSGDDGVARFFRLGNVVGDVPQLDGAAPVDELAMMRARKTAAATKKDREAWWTVAAIAAVIALAIWWSSR